MAHVGIMSHEDPDPTVWGTSTKIVLSGGGILAPQGRQGVPTNEESCGQRLCISPSSCVQCWEVGNQPQTDFPEPHG